VTDPSSTRRTTQEWLDRLGGSLRLRRVAAGLTQEDLAQQAGIGLSAVKHLESGHGANLTSFVKAVRALGAEGWLDALTPPAEPAVSPMQLLRDRQRAVDPRSRRVRRSARSS
jgi:transcriptional regulator with XRE-family HTH domain